MSKTFFSLCNFDKNKTTNNPSCRFIPSRCNLEENELMSPKHISQQQNKQSIEEFNDENFFKGVLRKNLKNKKKYKTFTELAMDNQDIVLPQNKLNPVRKVNKTPFKVLDAPYLQDDYYLNVVDWSQRDNLAVGLGDAVYMWNFTTNEISKILQNQEENFVSCIQWNTEGDMLGIGSLNGRVDLVDIETKKTIHQIEDHIERVGALSIHENMLLTGSRDNCIYMYDLRIPNNFIKLYPSHKQEVCGIKWSPDGKYFASGGNDNKLYLYSPKMDVPIMKKNHLAAVKALAWCPLRSGILATGSGTADRCIRTWNVTTDSLIDKRDTGSQICNLIFSKKEEEIITAHGFSNNEVNVWSLKGLNKVATLKGHTSRVLYLTQNPTGDFVVSGAGDETLRFWNLGYQEKKKQKSANEFSLLNPIGLR